jgi:hypothetical protein
LRASEIKLAGLQIPGGLSPDMNAAVKESIAAAFVFGFRVVMLISAGLSLGSAVVAWSVIPKDRDQSKLRAMEPDRSFTGSAMPER